jgi:hypothetical protein
MHLRTLLSSRRWPVSVLACGLVIGGAGLAGPGWAAAPVERRPDGAGEGRGPALPAVNLWVEFRQVDEDVRDEPARGTGLVVGTATARPEAAAPEPGSLRVRNGGRAEWQSQRAQGVTHVQQVWSGPPGSSNGPGGAPGASGGLTQQHEWLRQGRQVAFSARWAGDRQPVDFEYVLTEHRLEARADNGQPQPGEGRTAGQVWVPLDRWVTLARSGPATPAPVAGVYGTSAASASPGARVLQVRVRVAPP